MSNALIRAMEQEHEKEIADFRVGDTVRVHHRIREGNKERVQVFEGFVIQRRGSGMGKSFTVRKISANGIGVEKVFPVHCPALEKLEVVRKGKVRRAKLYYLRKVVGTIKIKPRRNW